jgi:hypothetical protein
MIKGNLEKDVAEILSRSAVTFDTDRRYNNQKAWPFWYPFIPKPYLETDILNNGLGLQGITVRAGETKEINVRLDRDTIYRQLNVKYTPFRCSLGPQITGTISTTAGDATVTGTGTTFTTAAPKGTHISWLDDAGNIRHGVVDSVTSNTSLELEQPVTTATTDANFFHCLLLWYDTPPMQKRDTYAATTGTIEIAAGGDDIAGSGTDFDPEINVGDVIQVEDADGVLRNFMIATRSNDTTATITETLAAGDPGVPAGSTFTVIATALTGTITADPANRLITGVGTSFDEEVKRGDTLFFPNTSGVVQAAPASDIASDLLLKTSQPIQASSAGDNIARGVGTNQAEFKTLTGTISAAAAGTAIVGTGTSFTTELRPGDRIQVVDSDGVLQLFEVDTITDDTNLDVVATIDTAAAAGSTFFLAGSILPKNLFRYRPLTDFIRVSYIMKSLRGRYLYGGTQEFLDPSRPTNSGLRERPHLISALQGADDGLGMLRTAMLFAYDSVCALRIQNLYTEDIIINGALYGYKVDIKGGEVD